jgi:hypothetical protein
MLTGGVSGCRWTLAGQGATGAVVLVDFFIIFVQCGTEAQNILRKRLTVNYK